MDRRVFLELPVLKNGLVLADLPGNILCVPF